MQLMEKIGMTQKDYIADVVPARNGIGYWWYAQSGLNYRHGFSFTSNVAHKKMWKAIKSVSKTA